MAFLTSFSEKFLDKRETSCSMACWAEPFKSIVGKLNVTVAEYLDFVEKEGLPPDDTPFLFRVKNFQGFELGLDNNNFDVKYIYDEILRLDDIFDLIMVQEKLQTCSILRNFSNLSTSFI